MVKANFPNILRMEWNYFKRAQEAQEERRLTLFQRYPGWVIIGVLLLISLLSCA